MSSAQDDNPVFFRSESTQMPEYEAEDLVNFHSEWKFAAGLDIRISPS